MSGVIDTFTVLYKAKFDQKSAEQVTSHFTKLKDEVSRIQRVFAGLAKAFVGFHAVAVKMAIDYEGSFTRLRTQLGATNEEMEHARRITRKLSKEYGQSVPVIAEAYFNLRSAGLSQANATEALIASTEGAALKLGSVAEIANYASSAVNVFGSSGLTASKSVKSLWKAIKEGKISDASALASNLSKVMPAAEIMDVDLDQVLAMMARISRLGLNPALASTAIRAMLLQMSAPMGPAQEWYEQLGLGGVKGQSVIRNYIKDKGVVEYLVFLRKKIQQAANAAGIIDKQEVSSVVSAGMRDIMGSIEAMTAVNALLNNYQQEYAVVRPSISQYHGYDENLEYAVTRKGHKIQAAINELKVTIASWGEHFAWVIDLFTSLPKAVQHGILALSTFNVAASVGLMPTLKEMAASLVSIGASILLWRKIVQSIANTRAFQHIKKSVGGVGLITAARNYESHAFRAYLERISKNTLAFASLGLPAFLKPKDKAAQRHIVSRIGGFSTLIQSAINGAVSLTTTLAKGSQHLFDWRRQLTMIAGIIVGISSNSAFWTLAGGVAAFAGFRQTRKWGDKEAPFGMAIASWSSALFGNRIIKIIGKIGGKIMSVFWKFSNVFRAFLVSAKGGWATLIAGMIGIVLSKIPLLRSLFSSIFANFKKNIRMMILEIQIAIKPAFEWIKYQLGSVWDYIAEKFKPITDLLGLEVFKSQAKGVWLDRRIAALEAIKKIQENLYETGEIDASMSKADRQKIIRNFYEGQLKERGMVMDPATGLPYPEGGPSPVSQQEARENYMKVYREIKKQEQGSETTYKSWRERQAAVAESLRGLGYQVDSDARMAWRATGEPPIPSSLQLRDLIVSSMFGAENAPDFRGPRQLRSIFTDPHLMANIGPSDMSSIRHILGMPAPASSHNTFNIYQRPGENSEELSKRIANQMENVRNRLGYVGAF